MIHGKNLASLIDHTLLRPDATERDIERHCDEARVNHFFGVCVNGSWVAIARRMLEGSSVKVISVAGFPLGAMTADAKRRETERAVEDGADEIDFVINIGRLKQGDTRYILDEIAAAVRAAGGRTVKAILETCFLSRDEKILACRLAMEGGARFVKTSTGFASSGATVQDVKLMREIVGPGFGVKASGGIRNRETAIAMLEAGANRLGTSASVAIIKGDKE